MSEELEREAKRLYTRYQIEIVEACGLCPWAQRVRESGAMRVRVVGAHEPALDAALDVLDAFAAVPGVDVGVVIYPRLVVDRGAFDHLVSRIRVADAARYEVGRVPFVLAAFHPDADADATNPERLVPFLRRTPDPTIQLVRASGLERVRARAPHGTQFVDLDGLDAARFEETPPVPLRERIARANLETIRRLGVAALRARLDAIRQDRDETYRRLEALGACARAAGLTPSPSAPSPVPRSA